jgi:hypothetical protein
MSKTHALLKSFSKKSKVALDGWSTTEAGSMLLIGQIPSRDVAGALRDFLTSKGMFCTICMGDRHGATWKVSARPVIPGLYDPIESPN